MTAPLPIRFDDVADLYDEYVTWDLDLPFWAREAQEAQGPILELTCGTGRVSIHLLRAGVDLTCVDYSKGMLERLRAKLDRERLSCPVVEADITELSLPGRFDLAFIPFHSFQEIVDRSRHRPTLERIRSHLTETGRFICTLQNPEVRLKSIDGKPHPIGRFRTNSGGSLDVSSQLSYDPPSGLVQGHQLYHLYDNTDTLIETRRLAISFVLFPKDEFERLAVAAGFDVETLLGDYDSTPFDHESSPFMIWVLRKSPRGS